MSADADDAALGELITRADAVRRPTVARSRLVRFLRRYDDEGWPVGHLMNSHSRPMEPIP